MWLDFLAVPCIIMSLCLTYFIAKASVQQEHESLVLHAVTLVSKVVIVSEQVPDKVELIVMSSQLEAMVVLQLDRMEPWVAALEADLNSVT